MTETGADSNAADAAISDDVVTHVAHPDPGGGATARAVLTPHHDTRSKEIHADVRPPIPVIFLPGVMGTLLVNKNTGDDMWTPPNTDHWYSYGSALSIITGWFAGAASREKRYDATVAAVNPNGPVDVEGAGISEAEAKRRGWGTVHRTSYSQPLAWLEHQLNHPMEHGEPTGFWHSGDPSGETFTLRALLGTDPKEYGASGDGSAIAADSDDFKHFARYRYPVYAIGYNWLQSNFDSASDVLNGTTFTDPKTKKTTQILGIHDICKENQVDRAIILTHSMGGLVARFLLQQPGGDTVTYGVVHGVQPATGAPLAAKRFRTGGEGFINESLMGANAAEFVAISANAPGPLELTPMPDYHNGAPWWIVRDGQGNDVLSLPKSDALSELYLNSSWYGLLPPERLLDPAGIVAKRLDQLGGRQSVMSNYKDTMRQVVQRQRSLQDQYHPNTYAFYADGAIKPRTVSGSNAPKKERAVEPGNAEKDLLTWGTVVWKGNIPFGVTESELMAAPLISDDQKGVVRIKLRGQDITVTVQQAAVAPSPGIDNGIVPGDGTVPIWSSEAQGRGVKPGLSGNRAHGMQMVFTQGGYAHQFCYSHAWARWATLYSVVRIAQQVTVETH
jgi:hypothetical protein